ncbi:Glycoside hydrolase [Olea europaea subsp. europaea]|uniref:Glycoside hydrolase n=1 Tax=Olea europaea subsp. europaea TaxID=158383 RepID=A0A8S0TVJ0_OLEEU|nr:Glycoside hydrolase [Olea europaea subsp. europaea]
MTKIYKLLAEPQDELLDSNLAKNIEIWMKKPKICLLNSKIPREGSFYKFCIAGFEIPSDEGKVEPRLAYICTGQLKSIFVVSGKYKAHGTGDTAATLENLAHTIPSIFDIGIFGIPMVRAGYMWFSIDNFYPFARGHSEKFTIRRSRAIYLGFALCISQESAWTSLPYLYTSQLPIPTLTKSAHSFYVIRG